MKEVRVMIMRAVPELARMVTNQMMAN